MLDGIDDAPPVPMQLGSADPGAKKVVVQMRKGYIEPVNLFVAVVLPPANRKSAVFREVTAPVEAYEKQKFGA